jgi:protein O-GlcNAc transferase
LPNIDYFLSGDALEPENAQDHYREKLVLLPGLGASPERPPAAGDGSWIGTFADGAPLVLCLQNHLKLVPSFDAVLARIVKRSGAKLGFFIRNVSVARRFRERIETAFRSKNLDPDRSIVFLPTQSHELYLGAIQRATLILDPPWFSGGATSLDAFSVGAPVLAFEGPMARCRQTSGMLRMMGVEDLIADNETDYVEKAVALIANENARAALREQILQNNDCLFETKDAVAAFSRFIEEVCGR